MEVCKFDYEIYGPELIYGDFSYLCDNDTDDILIKEDITLCSAYRSNYYKYSNNYILNESHLENYLKELYNTMFSKIIFLLILLKRVEDIKIINNQLDRNYKSIIIPYYVLPIYYPVIINNSNTKIKNTDIAVKYYYELLEFGSFNTFFKAVYIPYHLNINDTFEACKICIKLNIDYNYNMVIFIWDYGYDEEKFQLISQFIDTEANNSKIVLISRIKCYNYYSNKHMPVKNYKVQGRNIDSYSNDYTKYFLRSQITFKSDLTNFGGDGLAHARNVQYNNDEISKTNIDLAFNYISSNLKTQLQSFNDVNIEEQCDFCKKRFLTNPYSKFEYIYCSMNCINEHKQLNWKNLK